MNSQEFELFVRDRASLGWSRNWVCETLGITAKKLEYLTEGIKDIPWPKHSRSAGHRLHYESIKGYFPVYLRCNLAKARVVRASRVPKYELCGISSSLRNIYEIWADQIDVSASQIRRRLSMGAGLYDALFLPAAPPGRRNQGRKSHTSS
jgi:hypothetical protein